MVPCETLLAFRKQRTNQQSRPEVSLRMSLFERLLADASGLLRYAPLKSVSPLHSPAMMQNIDQSV